MKSLFIVLAISTCCVAVDAEVIRVEVDGRDNVGCGTHAAVDLIILHSLSCRAAQMLSRSSWSH